MTRMKFKGADRLKVKAWMKDRKALRKALLVEKVPIGDSTLTQFLSGTYAVSPLLWRGIITVMAEYPADRPIPPEALMNPD